MKKVTIDFPFIDEISNMWKGLTKDEIAILRKNTSLLELKKNENIYLEGEVPTHAFCLISGKVKISKEGIGGKSQIMRMVGPSEIFAYRAAFANENYLTSASAIETSYVYSFPLPTLKTLVLSNSKIALNFLEALSIDLGKTDIRVLSITQKHIRGRLADSILMLREKYGVEEDNQTLCGSLSRDDLACFANMTASNAIRTLSTFVAEGIIELKGRKIKILDEVQLKKASRLG